MKPPTAKLTDSTMRFFTPELYVRFNSADEDEADEADEAWENAIGDYRQYLDQIRDQMPSQVRMLSDLNLHDVELLAIEQVALPAASFSAEASRQLHFWSALAIVSVKQDSKVVSLIYGLWDRLREHPACYPWPFSKSQTHWLYDEVDIAAQQPGKFLHRVLLSDGRVLEIPFLSVVMHNASLSPQSPTVISQQIA